MNIQTPDSYFNLNSETEEASQWTIISIFKYKFYLQIRYG